MTVFDVLRMTEIRQRQANRNSDVVQLRADVDWLVGQVQEAHATIRDLRRAIGDIEVLAHDARTDAFAAEQLARMVRTNQGVGR